MAKKKNSIKYLSIVLVAIGVYILFFGAENSGDNGGNVNPFTPMYVECSGKIVNNLLADEQFSDVVCMKERRFCVPIQGIIPNPLEDTGTLKLQADGKTEERGFRVAESGEIDFEIGICGVDKSLGTANLKLIGPTIMGEKILDDISVSVVE